MFTQQAYHFFASSTVQIATNRVETSWEWYVIRASGFVAAGLLMLLMISGIGHVTGFTYRFLPPLKAWAIHKAMAYALLLSILVHVTFVLLDSFIKFSVPQVLIPFLSKYNNGTTFLGLALGGLAVTFGILAMYGIVIIVLTSLGFIDTRPRAWRWFHKISYLVVALIFLHGLFIGSDLKYGTFRTFWEAAGIVLALAIVSRLLRAGTLKKKPRDDDGSDIEVLD
jgi:predicted ferric reductase